VKATLILTSPAKPILKDNGRRSLKWSIVSCGVLPRPEEHTREQIRKVRPHPWIAKDIPVRGVIFDMATGRLREVKLLEDERAAVPPRAHALVGMTSL
jgi:hypothetical protein